MFGFAEHRRPLLEAEARRFADEAQPFGAMAAGEGLVEAALDAVAVTSTPAASATAVVRRRRRRPRRRG